MFLRTLVKMLVSSRLKTQVFVGVLLVLLSNFAISHLFLHQAFSRIAKRQVDEGLNAGRLALDRFLEVQTQGYFEIAKSLAETPYLKATLTIPEVDHETLLHTARELQRVCKTDLLLLLDVHGRLLVDSGRSAKPGMDLGGMPGVDSATLGKADAGVWELNGSLFQVTSAPIVAGERVGILSLGERLDQEAVQRFHAVAGSNVLLVHAGRVLEIAGGLDFFETADIDGWNLQGAVGDEGLGSASPTFLLSEGSSEQLATAVPLTKESALVLSRSIAETLAPYRRSQQVALALGLLSVLLGLLVCNQISTRVTKPIQGLTEAAGQLAEGNFESRVPANGSVEVQLLARAFNGMAKHIGKLVREVQENLRLAEAASAAKSEFLANMSHELRTPLHGILSFARFGIKKHATVGHEKLASYFNQIEQSGTTLLDLLNDLLDFARLECGKQALQIQQADFCELVEVVVDEFRSLLAERSLDLRWEKPDQPVAAAVDGPKIKQVIRNLLSNATKFAETSTTVEANLRYGDSTALFVVRDQGPGIPEDELEAIFDKFVQSTRTKSGAGGTGLGLAICSEIIAGHGGRIWAENNPEGGAAIAFEIPLHPREDEELPCELTGRSLGQAGGSGDSEEGLG